MATSAFSSPKVTPGEKFVEMMKNCTVEPHSDIEPYTGLGWKGP